MQTTKSLITFNGPTRIAWIKLRVEKGDFTNDSGIYP